MITTESTRTDSKKGGKMPISKRRKKFTKHSPSSSLLKASSAKRAGGRKSGKGFIERAIAAPTSVQVGTAAAVVVGSYALWKNREKIQEMIAGFISSDSPPIAKSH